MNSRCRRRSRILPAVAMTVVATTLLSPGFDVRDREVSKIRSKLSQGLELTAP